MILRQGEFRTAYLGYEAKAARGELKVHKR
jgi:hypothetical protein